MDVKEIVDAIVAQARAGKGRCKPTDSAVRLSRAESERVLPHVPGPYCTKSCFCGSYRDRHRDINEVSREILLNKRPKVEKE